MHEIFAISEEGERRIFEGELVGVRGNRARVRGFHLEDSAVMEAQGITIVEATRTATDSRGVYLAQIEMQGASRKPSYGGFFPVDWSRDDVRAAIAEAYSTRWPIGWTDAGDFYRGQTRAGMRIVMELDERGRVLDAFPLRAGKGLANRKRDALFKVERGIKKSDRLVCGECHALKVLVCPNGHGASFHQRGLARRVFSLARRLFS